MKKTLLFISVIFVSFLSAWAQPKNTFVDNWHLNINAGPTILFGDVTQHYDWYKPDFSTPKMAFGINLTKDINCWFALRGQIGYGWVSGKKDFYNNGDPAGLKVDAHYYHFTAQAKINFIDMFAGGKCYRRFNLYGFAGLGFINFQNRLYKDGIEQLSWGYGRTGTHRWVTEITVPYGLGVDARIGQKWRINLDLEILWVDNEKLDRVVGGYEHDAIFYPNIGVSYNISKYNRVCCKKESVPIYVSDEPRMPEALCDKVIAKADSMNDLLDKSFDKINVLNLKIIEVEDRLDSIKLIKDTVYIIKEPVYYVSEGTHYPDSINRAMGKEGYIWYNVYFDLDKYNIKHEYDSVIANVAEIMRKEPDLKVRIVGNADQRGTLKYNDVLSKNRSQAVINVLVNKHGIDRNRLVLEYLGERKPLSKIHFNINRRVDFIRVQ